MVLLLDSSELANNQNYSTSKLSTILLSLLLGPRDIPITVLIPYNCPPVHTHPTAAASMDCQACAQILLSKLMHPLEYTVIEWAVT